MNAAISGSVLILLPLRVSDASDYTICVITSWENGEDGTQQMLNTQWSSLIRCSHKIYFLFICADTHKEYYRHHTKKREQRTARCLIGNTHTHNKLLLNSAESSKKLERVNCCKWAEIEKRKLNLHHLQPRECNSRGIWWEERPWCLKRILCRFVFILNPSLYQPPKIQLCSCFSFHAACSQSQGSIPPSLTHARLHKQTALITAAHSFLFTQHK